MSVLVLNTPVVAFASKIEKIQKALKEECQVGVSSKKALTLIRPLYLTCVPGTKVSLQSDEDRCDVKCLKGNSNVIVER
ncbi:hypothetical protein AZI86_08955 [Bdellovibrio bacteriovorus]|uniref:Uncharacterized protein n=2 Tax=Bdellovibrio bacteriovorus TaxID=959 RepID=A0A150WS86_BDEBC|nr:hypothetical protein AZI86_08955 [Bdellovibrio bacteriovorus]